MNIAVRVIRALESGSRSFRKSSIPGVGFKQIFSAVQSSSRDSPVKHATVMQCLCNPILNIQIFKFEGADANDVYFSLLGSPQEMITVAESLPSEPTFDRSLFNIDSTPIAMPAFEMFVAKAETINRSRSMLMTQRAQQINQIERIRQDLALLADPSALVQEDRRAREEALIQRV
jgi:hypothetical protein